MKRKFCWHFWRYKPLGCLCWSCAFEWMRANRMRPVYTEDTIRGTGDGGNP